MCLGAFDNINFKGKPQRLYTQNPFHQIDQSARKYMNQVSDRLHHVFKIQSQHKWVNKVSTAEQRIEKLLKLKAVVQSREDDLVQALHADLRKDEEGARGEATPIYGEVDQALAELSNWMTPIEADPTPFIGSRAKIMPESRGVVLLFSPWNYPFALLSNHWYPSSQPETAHWLSPTNWHHMLVS